MEDAHSYTVDYAGIHGQGFFAIFDGHAGKEAADWCGENFHKVCSFSSLFIRYIRTVPSRVASPASHPRESGNVDT